MHSSASKYFFKKKKKLASVSRTTWPLKLKSLILSGIDCLSLFYFFFVDAPLLSNQRQRVAGQLLPAGMPGSFPFFLFCLAFWRKSRPWTERGGRTIVSCSCSEVGRSRKTEELGLWPWQNQPASLWLIRIWTDGRTEGYAAAPPPTHHHLKTHYSLLFGLIH